MIITGKLSIYDKTTGEWVALFDDAAETNRRQYRAYLRKIKKELAFSCYH